ncbi:MAG: exodeoxyribonuclease VII small subunit [Thermaerobacter sp.]|nr:exodeoxyribonuclease VII small subunit [Thermaerobacter sp.]
MDETKAPEDVGQYEAIIARLEEIIRLLEGGRAPLAESLRLFQEAKRLSGIANDLLERAETVLHASTRAEEG